MKSILLTSIIAVASAIAFAGEPTPSEETDLPASFTSALNGTKLQEGLSDQVNDAANKMTLTFLSDEEKICKKCFFYAAAKLLEILDDEELTGLLGELGYEIWTGSDKDREIYIRGFFNEETTLTPNDVIDKLYEIICPRINYAITTKTTYMDKYSLEVCAADENWNKSFDIDFKVLGVKLFETDYSVDRGDAYAVIGALRAVEAVLCYLKGVDLSGNSSIPDLIARIAPLISEEPDLETIVAELSDFLRTTKPRVGGQQWLDSARTHLKDALANIQKADNWILNTRTDRAQHLIGKDAEEIEHLIAYDVSNPIIALARDYCTTVSTMLSGSVLLTRDQLVDILYTAGLFEKKVTPPWLAKTAYSLSLAPLFNASIKWVDKLPQVDGDYVCIDTLPDPTIGGIFAGFKQQDAITLLEELTVKEQFTYDGYVEYNVNMPYRDGTVGEDRLQHAQPRRIVMSVEGEVLLKYDATMKNADTGSVLKLYVDGELIQTDKGGEENARQFLIEGSGEHTLVWVYTGPLDENGRYLREKTIGVRPLANVVFDSPPPPPPPPTPPPALFTLKIQSVTNLSFVVSTNGIEIAATSSGEDYSGYTLVSNATATIRFTPAEGYQFVGTPTNPRIIESIAGDVTLTAAELPSVEVVEPEEPEEPDPPPPPALFTLKIQSVTNLSFVVSTNGIEIAATSSGEDYSGYTLVSNATATIRFTPAEGYQFLGGAENQMTVGPITADTTLAAADLPEVEAIEPEEEEEEPPPPPPPPEEEEEEEEEPPAPPVPPALFTLKIPVVTNLSFVVSTNEIEIAATSSGEDYSGYTLVSNATATIRFTPAEGYQFVGGVENRMTVGPITADTTLAAADLPEVEAIEPEEEDPEEEEEPEEEEDPPPQPPVVTRPSADGTVTRPKPVKNTDFLKANATATWKAKAAAGCVFAGWTWTNGTPPAAFAALSANETKAATLKIKIAAGERVRPADFAAVWYRIDEDTLGEVTLTPSNLVTGSKSYVTASVSGLPSGMKFDKKSLAILGAPRKAPQTKTVKVSVKNASGYTFKQNYLLTINADLSVALKPLNDQVRTGVAVLAWADPACGVNPTLGKVTGAKVAAVGKSVTLKATPAKGCIFLGWYEDAAFEVPAKNLPKGYLTASQKVVVPAEGLELFARFVWLKPWAVGTFNGGGEDGIVTLTVSSKGKLSGKYLAGGKTWKLSAAAYTDHAETNGVEVFYTMVTAKCGKETRELELAVAEEAVHGAVPTPYPTRLASWRGNSIEKEELRGPLPTVSAHHSSDRFAAASPVDIRREDASGTVWFVAYRNGWKEEPLKTLAKELKNHSWSETVDDATTIDFKVGASGSVKAKLTTTGLNGKPYSATCSTVLIPTENEGYVVFVYFPPKSGKIENFARRYEWR